MVSGHRITELWAWITLDDGDGDEGIPAFMGPNNTAMPLIGSDHNRIESLRPVAEEVAAMSRHAVELRHFTVMTVEDTIPPGRS